MKTLPFLIFLLSFSSAETADVFFVAPNHLQTANGNSDGWPFSFPELEIDSRRYQQVYDASQFAIMGPNGGYIKQLLFREGSRGANRFLPSVQIDLGTTPRIPDGLSPVFSENIGDVYTTVYASSLSVSTPGGWAVITLSQPFFFSPTQGNLLMDIRTFTSSEPDPFMLFPTLDAEDTLADSISAVMANDVNALSGVVTTHALVTGFIVEPIPEPGTWVLLGLGLLGIRHFLRRKSKITNQSQ